MVINLSKSQLHNVKRSYLKDNGSPATRDVAESTAEENTNISLQIKKNQGNTIYIQSGLQPELVSK